MESRMGFDSILEDYEFGDHQAMLFIFSVSFYPSHLHFSLPFANLSVYLVLIHITPFIFVVPMILDCDVNVIKRINILEMACKFSFNFVD